MNVELPRRLARPQSLHRPSILCIGIKLLLFMSLGGCASDTTGPALVDPAHLYYQLTLNHDAITMALTPLYDTLQLIATPLAATGAPLADSGITTWTSSDSSVLTISSNGRLTALAPASGITVTASRMIGGVVQTRTAVVNINDTSTVPRFAKLIVQADSNLFGLPSYDLLGEVAFNPSALDSEGDTIPNIVVRVTIATPANLIPLNANDVWRGAGSVTFQRNVPGHARVIAEATVYSVDHVDTLPFTVGWWGHIVVQIGARNNPKTDQLIGVFTPVEDTVAVGGSVIWQNTLPGTPADIVFDDPAAAQPVDSATFLSGFAQTLSFVIPSQGGGNIAPFAPLDTGVLQGKDTLGTRARRFPVAGTYRYHSALYGTTGVLHVLPQSRVP